MSRRIYLPSFLFSIVFSFLFSFQADGQGSEVKESGLQLTVSAGSFSSFLYVYGCGYGIANWQDVLHEDLCAPLVWGGGSDSLGCFPGDSLFEGKIVLIRQGECPIATKVRHAQDAGAKAVLVVDYKPNYLISKHALGEADELPAVNIPAFYITSWDVEALNAAFTFDTTVTACLNRPVIYLDQVGYPAREILQHCASITDPFRFSVRLSNLSGENVQNVNIHGELRRDMSFETYTDTLFIPEISASVTDSFYEFPNLYPALNLYNGIYFVEYTVTGSLNDIPFTDKRSIYFNTNDRWVGSDLSGRSVGYRPDTIPEMGWVVANLLDVQGSYSESYYAQKASISILSAPEMGTEGQMAVELWLFALTEDVLPDLSNFETGEFFSSSLIPLGNGSLLVDMNENKPSYETLLINLNTGEPDLLIQPDKQYLLAALFQDQNKFIYQGFSEAYNAGKPNTFVFTDKWYIDGLYGNPNAVLRLGLSGIDLNCVTLGNPEPGIVNFNLFPNPVKDNLYLRVALPEVNDAVITLTDISGREILTEYRKNLNEETLTFPVSQFPNGAYAVRITTVAGSGVQKLIIQKE